MPSLPPHLPMMIRLCGNCLSTFARQSSLHLPLIIIIVLLHLCQVCNCDSKCYACDNYFELNQRNKDPNMKDDMRRRYCSAGDLPPEEHQADCVGKDYTGCVKIITKSWRHHIDKTGYGLRSDNTLIASVVSRDCADVPPGMGYGCHTIMGSSTTREICYCQGEYCNGASVSGEQRMVTATALVLLALISLYTVDYIF